MWWTWLAEAELCQSWLVKITAKQIKKTVHYCIQFIRTWKRVTSSVFDRLCQLLFFGCCRLRHCPPNRMARWRVWTRIVRNPQPPSKACGRRPSRVSRAPQTLSWWVRDRNTILHRVKYLSQIPHTGHNISLNYLTQGKISLTSESLEVSHLRHKLVSHRPISLRMIYPC